MNDDFDARLYYDKKKIKGWLGSLLSEDGELKAVEKLITMEQPPKKLLELIPNAEYIFKCLKKASKEQVVDISNKLIQYLLENLDAAVKKHDRASTAQNKVCMFYPEN